MSGWDLNFIALKSGMARGAQFSCQKLNYEISEVCANYLIGQFVLSISVYFFEKLAQKKKNSHKVGASSNLAKPWIDWWSQLERALSWNAKLHSNLDWLKKKTIVNRAIVWVTNFVQHSFALHPAWFSLFWWSLPSRVDLYQWPCCKTLFTLLWSGSATYTWLYYQKNQWR